MQEYSELFLSRDIACILHSCIPLQNLHQVSEYLLSHPQLVEYSTIMPMEKFLDPLFPREARCVLWAFIESRTITRSSAING